MPGSLIDAALTLPSGTVIRVRHLIRFQGEHTTHLAIVIETSSPADDPERVRRDAVDVVALHRAYAARSGLNAITVQICRTQACIELRARPTESFHFEQAAEGAWVLRSSGQEPDAAL